MVEQAPQSGPRANAHTPGPLRILHDLGMRYANTREGSPHRVLDVRDATALRQAKEFSARCLNVLERLADRCDGEDGVRADGSNIDTCEARSLLSEVKGGQE